MLNGAQSTRAERITLLLRGLAVFLGSFVYFLWLHSHTPGLLDTDPYYHIKLSQLYQTEGVLNSFPWGQFSAWRDHFFDKDFLYHILLIPFTYEDLISGAKLAASIIAAVAALTFFGTLTVRRVPLPELFLLLIASCGAIVVSRYGLLRPHVVSVALTFVGTLLILERRPILIAALTFLFTLVYHAAFILVGIAAISLFFEPRAGRRKATWIVVACAAGFLVGSVVHPHFPNNLVTLWLQDVTTLKNTWASELDYRMAGELAPLSTRTYILQCFPCLIACGVASYFIAQGRVALTPQTRTIGLTSAVFFLLSIMSQRFIEYSVPFLLWWAAEVLRDAWSPNHVRERLVISGTLLAIIALVLPQSVLAMRDSYRLAPGPSAKGPADWLLAHAEPGETIFTCDWDDAAELFHFNSRNYYLVFNDPHYFMQWNFELWRKWRDITSGQSAHLAKSIKDSFKTRYVYCTEEFNDFISKALNEEQDSFAIRYSDPDRVILEILDTPTNEHTPAAHTLRNWEISRSEIDAPKAWAPLAVRAESKSGELDLGTLFPPIGLYSCINLRHATPPEIKGAFELNVRGSGSFSILNSTGRPVAEASSVGSTAPHGMSKLTIQTESSDVHEIQLRACRTELQWRLTVTATEGTTRH